MDLQNIPSGVLGYDIVCDWHKLSLGFQDEVRTVAAKTYWVGPTADRHKHWKGLFLSYP